MSFQDAVRRVVLEKYADFNGRARRSEFWWFALFSAILGAITSTIDNQVFHTDRVDFLSTIVSLALLLPSLAVGARRLHDTGRSGWLQLLALIPIVGIIILIVWWAKDSTPGANEHGPSPKAVEFEAPPTAPAAGI